MDEKEWRYQQLAKKKSSFERWLKHHQPILDYMYLGFLELCSQRGLPIEKTIESRKDFYRMMYEECNGELIDKKDYISFYPEEEYQSDSS
jgi:hypothetical protein